MAKLSLADVDHVAYLARLGLTDEERERFREQLSSVLEYADSLQQLDTSHIPPTAQVIALQNVMRDDGVWPSLTQEQVLANAPQAEDGHFRVRPVLE